jgi:hypothetical protein
MSLPPNHLQVGSTAVALQTTSGDTLIYYQTSDGSIRQRSGVGPVSSGAKYVDKLIIPVGMARVNTPLAAVSWSPKNFDQVNPSKK